MRQFRFFREHSKALTSRSRVILCSAEPELVSGAWASKDLRYTIEQMKEIVERQGAQVRLLLAGDVHNYQHYEVCRRPEHADPYPQTQLVSGGGGAFLHPTHQFASAQPCLNRYPVESESRSLTRGNLGFALSHRGFAAVVGALYVAVFWSVTLVENPLHHPFRFPGSTLILLALLGALLGFAKGSAPKRWSLGVGHWIAHVLMAYITWLGALWLTIGLVDADPSTALPLAGALLQKVIHFLLGGVLGATLFGVYLVVALDLAGVHHNEAFSGLAIANYKHFLRCAVRKDGLTIRVVAIRDIRTRQATVIEEVQLS